jgi:hypothetical protein
MNAKQYLFLLGITFLTLSLYNSCKKSSKEIEKGYFTDALSKIDFKDTIKWIVVLPGLGCDGCIQEGEAFMKKYIENKDILFVLTNISSLKILEQKIGIKMKEHQNIYIDRVNGFSISTENSIYPCIIQIKNGKVVSHEFQSPKNGMAFKKLENLVFAH